MYEFAYQQKLQDTLSWKIFENELFIIVLLFKQITFY